MTDRADSLPVRRWHVKDARGREVTQLDPVTMCLLHRHDVIDADTLEAVVEDLQPGTARLLRRTVVLVPSTMALIALGVTTLYFLSDAGARRDLISTLLNPAIMVPSLTGCVVPWFFARQAQLRRVWYAMLKHRRCPHCGYDLRLLAADPSDGATVCPECGCAWLIDDVALTERLAATRTPSAGAQSKLLVTIALLLAVAGLAGAIVFLAML